MIYIGFMDSGIDNILLYSVYSEKVYSYMVYPPKYGWAVFLSILLTRKGLLHLECTNCVCQTALF